MTLRLWQECIVANAAFEVADKVSLNFGQMSIAT
jgi:hypothetical protein